MAIVIGGIVCLAIAGLLIYLRKKNQDKLLEIKFVKTSTTAELKEICQSVKDELGTGGFKQQAEVKGVIKCAKPLTSELAKQTCVYYEMNVEERYEETYWEKDSEGRNTRRTRTGSTSVASNAQSVSFEVEDSTGRITVDPMGAETEAVQVLSRYEPATGGNIRVGSFSWNVRSGSDDRRILGYQFTEKTLPLDRPVYVLGEAADRSGSLQIQRPDEKGKPYIITYKSEEELTRGAESTIKFQLVGAIVALAAGVGAIAYGIIK